MKILAIDTSCDETAVAIIENDRILSNVLSSQIQAHQEWGGVVPSLAKRKHEELINLVLETALKRAKVRLEDIDAFAVTKGPGLAIALEVGIRKAKDLAHQFNKPLIPINHMEGHIYSALAKNSQGNPVFEYQFPLLALLISGGHTEFVLMMNHGQYEILGRTLDDALGESYDKVGRIMDMGYPAGPVLEKIAEKGDENKYDLPMPMQNSGNANMSYSGLKTAAMKLVSDELKEPLNKYGQKFHDSLQHKNVEAVHSNYDQSKVIADISASFQKAAVGQVLGKTKFILDKLKNEGQEIKDLIIAGGVSQNKYLRKKFKSSFGSEYRIHYPTDKKLYTDNAGMIGIAAYFNALQGKTLSDPHDINKLDRDPDWELSEI